MTVTAKPAPGTVVTPCSGNALLTVIDERGDYAYVDCSGCDDCDRTKVALRMALAGKLPADPFARIPTAPADQEW